MSGGGPASRYLFSSALAPSPSGDKSIMRLDPQQATTQQLPQLGSSESAPPHAHLPGGEHISMVRPQYQQYDQIPRVAGTSTATTASPRLRRAATEQQPGLDDDGPAAAGVGTGSDGVASVAACLAYTGLEANRRSTVSSTSGHLRLQSYRKPQFQLQLPGPSIAFGSAPLDGECDRVPPFISPVLLTPPKEIGQPEWDIAGTEQPRFVRLTPSPEPSPRLPPSSHPEEVAQGSMSAAAPGSIETSSPQSLSEAPSQDSGDALASSINLVVNTVIANSRQPMDKRVVVQVLPNPLSDSTMSRPLSLWNDLLERLLISQPRSPHWVSAIHAVPTNYPVENLPASAPSTPSNTVAGEAQDYFTPRRVVHTAAFMVDQYNVYTPRSGPLAAPGLASSPRSVDVALYQRIIPPSTAREVNELFDPNSQSALLDRLTELAPSGCLLFFYPTKEGARTFTREYLDRGLASPIRAVLLGKGLPLEACSVVARVESLSAVPDFRTMEIKLRRLVTSVNRDRRHEGKYSILSGVQAHVELPQKAWKSWWGKQEESRVKSVIEHYLTQAQAGGRLFHRDERYTSRGIVREVMTALASDTGGDSSTTDAGPIEVGIFVIKRDS